MMEPNDREKKRKDAAETRNPGNAELGKHGVRRARVMGELDKKREDAGETRKPG